MKSILQMCALVAVKHDPQLKEYYERKKAQSVEYPRNLENDRPKLNAFLKENLPHHYKPVK